MWKRVWVTLPGVVELDGDLAVAFDPGDRFDGDLVVPWSCAP